MTGLVIPITGPLFEIELDGDSPAPLQAAVGGYIQGLPLPAFIDGCERATAMVHDEGKLIGLEPNMRATDYMVPGVGIFMGDYIAGPMVLVGYDPNTGATADLPEGVAARARLIEDEAGDVASHFRPQRSTRDYDPDR